MPTRSEVAYFGAGPAPLPTTVLETGAAAFVNYNNTGLSLAEISHRSSLATRILNDTKAALASLLKIPDSYEILFCHGGGSGEFSAVVFNLVAVWVERRRRRAEQELGVGHEAEVLQRVRTEIKEHLRLDYIVTGSWSAKAAQEAANLLEPLGTGLVNVAVDARTAKEGKFGSIPDESTWKLTPSSLDGPESALIYFCDNETVDGVELPAFPSCLEVESERDERLVVADMSSNFLSRQVDVQKYAVIFGGAQKNIGITDITLVIVRKSLLAAQAAPSFLHACGVWSPPAILHWPTLAKNNSLYNTMPIFSIYIAGEVMRGLQKRGDGTLAAQQQLSEAKAAKIYASLDQHANIYTVCADSKVRSRMNICFRIKHGDAAAEKAFLDGAEARGLLGLKGHRSVGGIRVSNYNAVPMEDVVKLVDWLDTFAKS